MGHYDECRDGYCPSCGAAPGNIINGKCEFCEPKTLIFVFGSNLAGRHGRGAALTAKVDYGAKYGVGVGRTGDAYAIPTKGYKMEVLPLTVIAKHVGDFIYYAKFNSNLRFFVTRIGCGLAGYKDWQIAPMFKSAPSNCILPKEWNEINR